MNNLKIIFLLIASFLQVQAWCHKGDHNVTTLEKDNPEENLVKYKIEAGRLLTYELVDHVESLNGSGILKEKAAAYFSFGSPNKVYIGIEYLKNEKKVLGYLNAEIESKIEEVTKKFKIDRSSLKFIKEENPID